MQKLEHRLVVTPATGGNSPQRCADACSLSCIYTIPGASWAKPWNADPVLLPSKIPVEMEVVEH